ncbi:methyltransferase FkbM [Pseudomonas juntendi]|uniref:Methyltransferase FkbM n=1 Tax=Pseudomonas juntendi TaxID=2666183 RepID=A0ABZ2JGB8_9PSED|nr:MULTISPECIES: methyltransferase FkbM [Pseudomonas]MDH2012961.1 methyltransferase FkbM [Pseudomonas juntendi]
MSIFKAIANWLGMCKAPPAAEPQAADPVVLKDTDHRPIAQVVPYDENLLERSRTQWQVGDWKSLAQLKPDTLQHHPDRAKLAMLAAGGHQQLGNMTSARQFTRLAQDWGCSKKMISQVLIAGVHNTLGRATAIAGRSQQALGHFQNAVNIATPGADARMLVQARMREELTRFEIPALEDQQKQSTATVPATYEKNAVQNLSEEVQRQHATLSEQIKQQNAEMIKVRQSLERTVRSEMLNAAQQLEAFMGVQNFLNHGEYLPGMHGWPISPDFALYLVELINANDYDLVIEFGSGTSTVIVAKILKKLAPQRQVKRATLQVAFEHLEQYHAQTLDDLTQAHMNEEVDLVLAPLVPYEAADGTIYSYYDCKSKLTELATKIKSYRHKIKILVIVDGPPGSTGTHARYPAVPVVLQHFNGAMFDIVLDDYKRSDEKEVAQMWLEEIKEIHQNAELIIKKMDKDACLISTSFAEQNQPTSI